MWTRYGLFFPNDQVHNCQQSHSFPPGIEKVISLLQLFRMSEIRDRNGFLRILAVHSMKYERARNIRYFQNAYFCVLGAKTGVEVSASIIICLREYMSSNKLVKANLMLARAVWEQK